jgi:cold shock CspA family protein
LRSQGKVKSWNQAKGFGFISPNGGGKDVFLHISNFSNSRRTPAIGSLVTYEILLDESNRQKAINVKFVGEKIKEVKSRSIPAIFKLILFFGLIVFVIYNLAHNRGSSLQATLYKSIHERDYKKTDFKCEGKTHCSEMTSCNEALFYQENCSGTEMDGDNDGIPCEQQWCN